jgi:ariadne-1
VLTPAEVIQKQQQAIARVHAVLPTVPVGTARMLLQHFRSEQGAVLAALLSERPFFGTRRWDASKMLEEYTSNPARLRAKLGLPASMEEATGRREDSIGVCLICLTDEELMGEECGHKFCLPCWRDFLHGEVRLKHTVILCPGKDCSKVLDELTVIGYLDDEDTK